MLTLGGWYIPDTAKVDINNIIPRENILDDGILWIYEY